MLALYARPGIQRDIPSQFYERVFVLLELIERVDNISVALDSLEKLYRISDVSEAAGITASSRASLHEQKLKWESELIAQEDSEVKPNWHSYQQDIEPVLDSISSLGGYHDKFQEKLNMSSADSSKKIEQEYTEHRIKALQEIIAIGKRDMTDLELELARRGFSTEINRQLEFQKNKLKKSEAELEALVVGNKAAAN